MKQCHFEHPKPLLNRAVQYGAMFLFMMMVISAPLQAMLTLAGAPSGFILAGILTVLLSLPVLMLTALAPSVSVDDDGLTIHPIIWKQRTISWSGIEMVKVFPLLPTEDQEIPRKWVVGKQNYRPADGIMLVIPELPVQYRIAGFFAGERGKPIIALTSRAHNNYETLVQTILNKTETQRHDNALTSEL